MEFYQGLSLDLSHLLEDSDDHDVIIYAGKEPNIKKFHAHTVILRARSPYFRRALSRDWVRKENGSIIFQKPNIPHQVFEVILKYIYGGTANLSKQEGNVILNLLTASDELNLQELIVYAQDHLINQKSDWLQQNLVEVLSTVAYLEPCKDLQDFCLGIICQDPCWLFNSVNFCALEESVLIPLLKRDDLLMEEIEIWEHLTEWGIAQNLSLNNKNVSKWTLEDFELLKVTLQHCIPLIRYFNIDSADYYDKVRPFEKILPIELKEDILQYYMKRGQVNQLSSVILPPRITGIDSNIIKFRHIALISKWIERKENYVGVSKQNRNFNLLLRGSKDGFSATTFHHQCDNQGPTLVILKVKETGEILGGYNPLSWRGYNSSSTENGWMVTGTAWPVPNRPRHSSTFGSFGRSSSYDSRPYQSTIDSFIFSLGNGQNIANAKLSRVLQDNVQFAVCSSQRLGPCFGQTDLRMNDSFDLPAKCTCQCYDYDKEICELQSFSVEEFEVFQVVNKDDPTLNVPSPVQEIQTPGEVPNYQNAWGEYIHF